MAFPGVCIITSTPFPGRFYDPRLYQYEFLRSWICDFFNTFSDRLWSMGRYPGLHRARPSLYLLIF